MPLIQIFRKPPYDVSTLAHLSRLSSYDKPLAIALDSLIKGLKIDGIWAKIEMLCVQHYNSTDSLLDLKNIQDSTPRTGTTWSTDGWVMGSVAGQCIDSQVSPSTSSLINSGDNHLMLYINNALAISAWFYPMGAGNSSSNQISFFANSSADPDQFKYFGDTWQDFTVPMAQQNGGVGFLLGSMHNNINSIRVNTAESTGADDSIDATMPADTMYVGDFNGAFTGIANGSVISGWAAGGGLTATERSNYQTHIQTYMTTMGWNA